MKSKKKTASTKITKIPPPAPIDLDRRAMRRIMLIVWLAALVSRLVFLAETIDMPLLRTPIPGMDIALYWDAAVEWRSNLATPNFLAMLVSAPFFVFILSILQVICAEHFGALRVVMLLIGSCSCALVTLAAWFLSRNYRAALLSGLLLAFLPSLIFLDSSVHKATVEIFLITLLCGLILGVRRDTPFKNRLVALLGGLILAGLLLSQLSTFLLAPLVGLFFLLEPGIVKKERLIAAGLLMACVVLTASLFALRPKDLEQGRYLPQVGIHLFIGSQPNSQGDYTRIRFLPPTPAGHLFFARLMAEAEIRHPLSPSEADRYYRQKAIRRLLDNPGQTLILLARKGYAFFNQHELSDAHSLYSIEPYSVFLRLLTQQCHYGYGFLVLFALWGVGPAFRARPTALGFLAGLLLAFLAANLLTFVTWRYRIHAVVPLALLGGFGFSSVVDWSRQHGSHLKDTLRRHWQPILLRGVLPTMLILPVAFGPGKQLSLQAQQKKTEAQLQKVSQAEQAQVVLDRFQRQAPQTLPEELEFAKALQDSGHLSEAYRQLAHLYSEGSRTGFVLQEYLLYLLWLGHYVDAQTVLEELRQNDPGRASNLLKKYPYLAPILVPIRSREERRQFVPPH